VQFETQKRCHPTSKGKLNILFKSATRDGDGVGPEIGSEVSLFR
jgi:hypothetical protein